MNPDFYRRFALGWRRETGRSEATVQPSCVLAVEARADTLHRSLIEFSGPKQRHEVNRAGSCRVCNRISVKLKTFISNDSRRSRALLIPRGQVVARSAIAPMHAERWAEFAGCSRRRGWRRSLVPRVQAFALERATRFRADHALRSAVALSPIGRLAIASHERKCTRALCADAHVASRHGDDRQCALSSSKVSTDNLHSFCL